MKKKLLILLASTVAAILLAEVALRVFFAPYVTQIYRLDEEVLHRLVPGTSKYFAHHPTNGGHRVLVRVNSDGYRGSELRPKGEAKRVVVFGDSFVMAEFAELDKTFAERVERHLGTALGEPVEAINAGVVAYGPDQCLKRMERELSGLEADLAIVVVFADNDFGDLMRNKMFRVDDDGGLLPHEFRISSHLRSKFDEALSSTAIYRVLKRYGRARKATKAADAMAAATPEQLEQAAVAFIDQWLPVSRAEYRSYIEQDNPEVRSLFEDHYDTDVAVEPEGDSARYKVRLMRAVLGGMRDVAAQAGVPLLVVAVPSPADLCGVSHGAVVDTTKYPDYVPSRLTGRIAEGAQAHGVPCVNLFESFLERGPESLYYLPPDNHWNDAGQDFAAELVVQRVIDEALLND